MPPLSVPISDGDPSTAFFDQFSTIIRLEARLYGDHSEDVAGPAYGHWVVRHLTDVARAQGFTSPPSPAQTTTLNVHAQEFITPPPAQSKTSSRPVHSTPWYENFNLADQGVYDPSGPYHPTEPTAESQPVSRSRTPYTAFDPDELAQYRAVIREQLVHSSNSCRPTTPPSNFPRARYPSTPPNLPHRRLRLASPTEPFPDLVNDTTLSSLRASTEPLAEAKMGSLAAPDHYEPVEIYALEVEIGDYIQSVKNPGQVLDHYPCEVLDHQAISEHEARPVSPNGGLRIQFKGADGTVRSKVFKGLDKVQVLREVVAKDGEGNEVKMKEGEGEGEGEGQ